MSSIRQKLESLTEAAFEKEFRERSCKYIHSCHYRRTIRLDFRADINCNMSAKINSVEGSNMTYGEKLQRLIDMEMVFFWQAKSAQLGFPTNMCHNLYGRGSWNELPMVYIFFRMNWQTTCIFYSNTSTPLSSPMKLPCFCII